MAIPLILGSIVGVAVLWGLFSLVSFIAHWAAVIGGIAIFYNVLKYLLEAQPIKLFDWEPLDNASYLAAAIPAGLLGYKLLQAVFVALGVAFLLAIVIVVAGMALLGPARFLGWTVSIIGMLSPGDD